MYANIKRQATSSYESSMRMIEKSKNRRKMNETYSKEIKYNDEDDTPNRNTNSNLISIGNKESFGRGSYFDELLNKIKKKKIKFKKRDQKEKFQLKFDLFITITSLTANFIFFILYAIETYYDKLDITQEPLKTLIFLEFILNFYFVLEYFIFCYNYPGNKLKYIFSFFPLIDKASIASVFLNFFMTESTTNFSFIRVMRFLKLAKRMRTITNLSNIIKKISLNSEITQIVDPVKMQFLQMGSTLFVYFLIGSGVTLTIQDFFENSFNMPGLNFIDSLYFVIISSTSVGYGDIFPQGKVARIVAIFSIIFFIYIISDQIGKMINTLTTWGSGITEFKSENHIIIFSNSISDLKVFVEKIKEKTPKRPILIISERDMNISSLNDDEENNTRCSLLISNFQEDDLIERAKIKSAKDLFIFSNFDFYHEDINENDSKISYNKKYFKNVETMLFLRLINFHHTNPDLSIYIFSINFENFCFKYPTIKQMEYNITKYGSQKFNLANNWNLSNNIDLTDYDNYTNKNDSPKRPRCIENAIKIQNNWNKIQNKFKNFIRTQSKKLKDENYDLNDYSTIKKFFSLRKIKNLILAKSSINPGFLTFIQNLFFKPKIKLASLDFCFKIHKNSILEEYHNSSYNDLIIKDLPKQYENCTFNDFVKAVYFSSIYDYSKTYTNQQINYKFPILVIGVVKKNIIRLQKFESDERFYLFPVNMRLQEGHKIVCIANKFNNNVDFIFGNGNKTVQNELHKRVSNTIAFNNSSSEYSFSSNYSNDKDSHKNEKNSFMNSKNNELDPNISNNFDEEPEEEKIENNKKNIDYEQDEDINEEEVWGNNYNNQTKKMILKKSELECFDQNLNEFIQESNLDIPEESSINNKFRENLTKTNILTPLEDYNKKLKDCSFLEVKDILIHEEQKDNNFNFKENSYTNNFLNENILDSYNNNIKSNKEEIQYLVSKDYETPRKYNQTNNNNKDFENLLSLKKNLFNKKNTILNNNIDKKITKEGLNFDLAKADIMNRNLLQERNIFSLTARDYTPPCNKINKNQSEKKLSNLIDNINIDYKKNRKSKLNSIKKNSTFNANSFNNNDNFINLINNTPNNEERFSKMFINNLKYSKRKSIYSQNKVPKSFSKSMMEKNSYSSFFNCLKKYLIFDSNEGLSNGNSSTKTTGFIKNSRDKENKLIHQNNIKNINVETINKNSHSLYFDKNFHEMLLKKNNKNIFNNREKDTSKIIDFKKTGKFLPEKKSIINLKSLISENNNKKDMLNTNTKDSHTKNIFNKANSLNFKEKYYQISLNSEENSEKFLEDKKFILLASQVLDRLNLNNNLNLKLTKSLIDIITYKVSEKIDLKFLFDHSINTQLMSHYPLINNNIWENWHKLLLDSLENFNLNESEFIKPLKKKENKSIKNVLEISKKHNYLEFKEFSRKFFKQLHKNAGKDFDTLKSNKKISKNDSSDIFSNNSNNYSKKSKKDLLDDKTFDLHYDKNFKIQFENYILIIGLDLFDEELLDKLSFHHHNTKILITGDLDFSKKEELRKYLYKYENLYLAILDLVDPKELEKLNLQKVLKCFVLIKNFDNRVKSDLLNIQIINYFSFNYNFEIYIEQTSDLGNFLLGFTPKLVNSTIKDPYYHPLYMSGKIFYISQLKEICAASYMYEQLTEAWLSLIYCGYPKKNLSLGVSNPNIITIEIPEFYFNKEYIHLVKDLFLNDEISCIPLGLHYTSPFEIKNQKINKNLQNSISKEIREIEKTTIIDSNIEKSTVDKNEKNIIDYNHYNEDLEKMIEYVSYLKDFTPRNNLYLNEIYMFCIPTSTFITNPKPNLKINPGSKLMLLVDNCKDLNAKKDTNNKFINLISDENLYDKKENNDDNKINAKESKKKAVDEILCNIREIYHKFIDKKESL